MRCREHSLDIEMIQMMWATGNTFLKHKKYACVDLLHINGILIGCIVEKNLIN